MVEELLKRCFKVSVSQRVSGKWFVEAIATINIFNRISILSEHPVRARDAEGKLS